MSGQETGDGRSTEPKDMRGLLQLCAEAHVQNPADGASLEPMTEERKKWLEEALVGMSVSPVEEMCKGIAIVMNKNIDDDEKIDAINTIMDFCNSIDFAMDFHKIGGFDIFPVCFGSDNAELRWICLELIALLVQNNPYCQEAVLKADLQPKLLHILDNDPHPTVKTKALLALSCLSREHPKALEQFLQLDGFSSVMRAMQTDVDKLKVKAAFFISNVCGVNDKCKDVLCDMGMIDQLVGHLSEEHSTFHEHLLSALLAILHNHPRSLAQCQRPELNLLPLLKQKQQDLKGNEQFLEEYNYVCELLKFLDSPEPMEADNDVAR